MEQGTVTATHQTTKNVELKIRCVESNNNINGGGTIDKEEIIKLRNLVAEAERAVEEAEHNLASKKDELKKLKSHLENGVIKNVSQLKEPGAQKPAVNAAKKWRMAGLKVRLGVGGMAGTKRRDVNDAETFIVKESEVMIVLPKTFESSSSILFILRKLAKRTNLIWRENA